MDDSEKRSPYPLLAAGGSLLVLIVATWGFTLVDSGSLLDHGYRALQLFVLEAGDGFPDPTPWQLELTRLAAPAMTALSTALAAAALSRGRIDVWRARRLRDHVVVCGLGRHGTAAALTLRRAGHDVVGIDRDAAAAGVRRCRRARIPVVVGDARDPLVLESAGVAHAAHLVAVTPDLELTGRVALAAVDLVSGRQGSPLLVHVEVDDPALAGLLRALKLTEHHAPGWRIEELDLADAGARILVDEVSPWPEGAAHASVLVLGDSRLGAAVAAELPRRWRQTGRPADALEVTRVPSGSAGPVQGRPGAAYVCDEDETRALTSALRLLHETPGTPVAVHLEHATAFGELVHRDCPDLHVVSLDQRVLTPAVLLDTTTERVARALHESYRRHADPSDASAVPWELLPESLRASNRSQAGHVAEKIRATRRVLLPDDGEPPDDFTEDEVQLLGRAEHDRWTSERVAAGWTPGPRDPVARTSPYLVPWKELDEDIREIDRQFVRALPGVLADAGLVLRRTRDAAPTAATPG